MNAIDANNDDETAIQGQWIIVEVFLHGKRCMEGDYVIKDYELGRTRWRMPKMDLVSEWFSFRLDSLSSPKQYFLQDALGERQGIYSLSSDELITCMPDEPGMDLPICFESTSENGWNLVKCRRLT